MKYKLAGEDEHLFHIQHPDGSTFSIAKNAVGPGVHKQIKKLDPIKMADGGEVPNFDEVQSTRPSDEQTIESVSQPSNPMAERENLLKHYQDSGVGGISGGPETRADSDYQHLQELRKANPESLSSYQSGRLKELEGLASGPAKSIIPQSVPVIPEQKYRAPSTDQNIDSTPTDVSQNIPGNMSDAYSKAFAQKESGITGLASAQEKAAKAQADVYAAQADQIAKSQAHYEQAHAALDAEHKQLADAVMNDKIDPNRLYHNMSTGNKIIAAISVALGGLGAGLQGHGAPNLALGVIQKSIDRDIEAQKLELGKKQNLLSENLRRTGNLNTATQMTQLQMNAITQAKIAQISAKSGSAQAQAQAKMLLGDLGFQSAQIKQQMAMRDAASKGGNDPSALVQFIVPAPHQKAVFDEIERAQDTRRMSGSILKSFDDAVKDTSGVGSITSQLKDSRSVLALHQALQPTFKDLEGTVRQAAMDNTFKNISPNGFDTEKDIKIKREALVDYLKSKASAPTAKGFGIDLNKFGSTTTQAPPETAMMGGQKYQKVQGGWKKI